MANQGLSFASLLNEFNNLAEIKQLSAYYNQPNFLRVIGKHRNETAHSSFWAWLLNPNESHGMGIEPLKLFITTALPHFKKEHTFENVTVVTEHSIRSGRIDIFIDSDHKKNEKPFSIIVENKVDSSENEGQTLKYYEWARDHNKNKDNYFIYMKPYSFAGGEAKPLSVDATYTDGFNKVSFQELFEEVLSPLQSYNLNAFNNYLKEYICSLSITSRDDGHLIVTDFEKKQYEQIISNHTGLIEQIIASYGTDKTTDQSGNTGSFFNLLHYIRYYDFAQFSKLQNEINGILDGSRDFTKFVIKDSNGIETKPMPKNQLFSYILNKRELKNSSLKEFKELLPADLNAGDGVIEAYKSFENAKEAKQSDEYHNKKRKNPFYDFENIISLKDCVIVPKKAWTARTREELGGKSTIEILVEFVNSKEEFGLTIKAVE